MIEELETGFDNPGYSSYPWKSSYRTERETEIPEGQAETARTHLAVTLDWSIKQRQNIPESDRTPDSNSGTPGRHLEHI